ncbi:MAG: branched-chain amino acid ABC transporter permease [Alphaproteobacteria bacterium]|nr:branched-chain amino acid ABC transporter permease [Alphaproteobacteria bacterium]
MDLALQLLVNGIINGSHYALLGVGFGLIFGPTKITHFAFGPIFAVAAYVCWAAATKLGMPLAAAALVGIAASAAAGVLSYLWLYRPFERQGSSHLVVLIASLGLFITLENAIGIVFGTDTKVIADLSPDIFLWGPVVVTSIQLWQVAALALIAGLLAAFLRGSRHGKAIMAMTDNGEMAQIIGIDTVRVSILAFAAGSAVAAVPAVLILFKEGATPHMGFVAVFMAFVAVVVGGIGSFRGAIIGGYAVGIVENIGMWEIPTEWQSTIAFVVLFLILLFRPAGLFGRALR